MFTAIIYYSRHHENTKKLIDAIKAANPEIKTIDFTENRVVDLSQYTHIGIASGIYFGKFNKELTEYIKKHLPHAKKVFGIFTYGNYSDKYANEIQAIAEEKGCKWLVEYGCKGFDTFGPFKLVGGLQKGHPTEEEIPGAVDFYSHLML